MAQKHKQAGSRGLFRGGVFFFFGAFAVLLAGCSGRNINRDLHNDPKVLVRQWTLQTNLGIEGGRKGFEYSNPVLLDNTLIFGNRSVGLISLYPKLEQVRWNLPISGGVVSEVSVFQGSLFFGGGDGFLYSVNSETGRVNWRYDLHNPVISQPAVEGGRVFVTTSDDTVYAFDAGTGKWLWHYRRRTAQTATIRGASKPLVDGNEVIVGLSDGFLVSLSLPDGQLKWERKLHQGTRFTDVDAHPILESGVLYVPSYDGALYALKRQGGDTIWRFDSGGSKQVLIEDDHLYLPSSDGHVYCLQKSSGKILWKFEIDGGSPTQLVATEQWIIVGSSYQYLYAIDKKTGKGLFRFNSGWGSGFAGSPAYDPVQRRVYFLSFSGNLYSFLLRQASSHVWPHGSTEGYEFL